MIVLAASTLALWLTASLGFSDSISCEVQGYVNADPGQVPIFTRVDTCLSINQRIEDNALVLWSPHRWAVIALPANGTQVRLVYHWGSPTAYVDQEPLPVTWGLLLRG